MVGEKPILFQGWKVRTILDWDFDAQGDMQTRRVLKRTIVIPHEGRLEAYHENQWCVNNRKGDILDSWVCPYGKPGDRLWVKENWIPTCDYQIRSGNWKTGSFGLVEYPADGAREWREITKPQYGYLLTKLHDKRKDGYLKTRSARFMSRFISRILLEVTDVRLERVQEISEEDAVAEGVNRLFTAEQIAEAERDGSCPQIHGTKPEDHGWLNYLWHGNHNVPRSLVDTWEYQCSSYSTAKDSFSSLWHIINAKRGFGWDVNPRVWVVAFRRVKP